MKILVEVSARHAHLTKEDLEKLFGKGYELKPKAKLSQPKQFAAKEELETKLGKIRIIGPVRDQSQIEISLTDARKLGIYPPIRISGDIKEAPTIRVKGAKGSANIPVIIAKNHVHLSEKGAKEYQLKNKQKVSVKLKGEREITFNSVQVRVSKEYKGAFHIDTDEANAAGIRNKARGEIIK